MAKSTNDSGELDLVFTYGRVERDAADPDRPTFQDGEKLAERKNIGGPRHVPGIHLAVNFERLTSIQFSHGYGGWKQDPLSLQEIGLLRVMNYITDQKDWHQNVDDFDATAEWKRVAFSWYIVNSEIWDWCLCEVRHKATEYLKAPQFIFALDTASRVCKSDRLMQTSLLSLLKNATAGRTSSPWLYPFIFAQTPIRADGITINRDNFSTTIGGGIIPPRPHWDTEEESGGEIQYYSKVSQWIASDVEFTDNGNGVKFVSPINNLHPKRHHLLYTLIERLISEFIPEWNETLLYKSLPRNGPRVQPQRTRCISCVNGQWPRCSCPIKLNKSSEWKNRTISQGAEKTSENIDWCPKLAMDGKYSTTKNLYDNISLNRAFARRGLQVYVELFKVEVLPGGMTPMESFRRFDWNLNGNRNEKVVATSLLVLEHNNVEENSFSMSFRTETNMKAWDIDRPSPRAFHPLATPSYPVIGEPKAPNFQELVTVNLPEGRTVTYPNALQHKFSPFTLEDDSEPGHVQLLAVHLADPHYILCSTRHVPQQSVACWWEASGMDLVCARRGIPWEIRAMILDFTIGEGTGAPPARPPRLYYAADHGPDRPQEERPVRIEAAVQRREDAYQEHHEVVKAASGLRIYGVPEDLRAEYRALSQVTVPLDRSDAAESGYPLVNTVPPDSNPGGNGAQAGPAVQAGQGAQAGPATQPAPNGQNGPPAPASQNAQAGPSMQTPHGAQTAPAVQTGQNSQGVPAGSGTQAGTSVSTGQAAQSVYVGQAGQSTGDVDADEPAEPSADESIYDDGDEDAEDDEFEQDDEREENNDDDDWFGPSRQLLEEL